MSPFLLARALTAYATEESFGRQVPNHFVAPVRDALLAGRMPDPERLAHCIKHLDRLTERAAYSNPIAQAHLALVLQALQKLQD